MGSIWRHVMDTVYCRRLGNSWVNQYLEAKQKTES